MSGIGLLIRGFGVRVPGGAPVTAQANVLVDLGFCMFSYRLGTGSGVHCGRRGAHLVLECRRRVAAKSAGGPSAGCTGPLAAWRGARCRHVPATWPTRLVWAVVGALGRSVAMRMLSRADLEFSCG